MSPRHKLVGFIGLILALTLLASAGCTPKPVAKLRVGTEATLPPFESRNEAGEIVGFDMDLAQEIADRLDMELEIVDMAFDGLVPALEAGNVDLVIAGLMITAKRAERIDFSDEYCAVHSVVVVQVGNPANIKSEADLPGKTVAVQLGTTYDNFATSVAGLEVRRFGSYVDVFNEVKLGRVDGAVCLGTTLSGYKDTFADLEIAFDFGDQLVNHKGIGVQKGQTELLEKVNAALRDLQASGKMDELKRKWFGDLEV